MAAAIFERMAGEARQLGVSLEPAHIARFEQYLELLLTWNRRINLTAITDPDAILERHFLDSLAAAPLVPAGRLIDVGAGGGLPGIPIAIVRPDVATALLEATKKKAAFLRAAVYELGLSCTVLEMRLEDYSGARFDAAISRATFAPEEWLERAPALVRPGGTVLVMTGQSPPPVSDTMAYQLPGGERRHVGRFIVP
jgi:16S rRNA (guanine527-N7)-methyltransferase